METDLCDAIRNLKILEFFYDDDHRIVEPYCHGVTPDGIEVLRGYQRSGFSDTGLIQNWMLYRVSEIQGLHVTDRKFRGDRPRYEPEDVAMEEICCRI